MTKKNYTKYSESSKDNDMKPIEELEVEPEVKPEVVTTEEPEVISTVEPTVEPTVEQEETDEVEGIVLPNRLNVRKEANKESDVVCILTKDTSVVVILTESTEGFYKVRTSDFEGYCMKEFISI